MFPILVYCHVHFTGLCYHDCATDSVLSFVLVTAPNIEQHQLRHSKGKVKCTLVQGLRLCTGRTAHREVEV